MKALRKAMDLTQDELAATLGIASSTIGFWETGKVTPSKLTMAGARALLSEKGGDSGSELELPVELMEEAQRLSKKHGLDTSVILLQALRAGLAALSRDSSTDWKTLVKRQADIARRVEDREQPTESSRKRPRSKIA